MKWLLNLQNKPEGYRRRLTLFVSLGFTLIVIVFWLMASFSSKRNFFNQSSNQKEIISPIESISSSIGSSLYSLKDFFDWQSVKYNNRSKEF